MDCNTEYHIDNFGGDCPNCGQGLGSRSAKMSKSLGNTVSPGEMVDRFGADTVRLFILFGANPEAGMDWSDNAVIANHKQVCSIIDAFNHGISFQTLPVRWIPGYWLALWSIRVVGESVWKL